MRQKAKSSGKEGTLLTSEQWKSHNPFVFSTHLLFHCSHLSSRQLTDQGSTTTPGRSGSPQILLFRPRPFVTQNPQKDCFLRHKTSTPRRKPLKKRTLKPHD